MMLRRVATTSFALFVSSFTIVSASCGDSKPAASDDPGAEGGLIDRGVFVRPDAGGEAAADVVTDSPRPDTGLPEAAPVDSNAPPTCTDQIQNGNETDVDCGGPNCPPCGPAKKCVKPTDCNTSVCTTNICQPATCTDGVRNRDESDVDCGGTFCGKCAVGKKCNGTVDCISLSCNVTCQCPAGMVVLPTNLPGGGDYCVDSLEVPKLQYTAFWQANPNLAGQPAFCSWNTTYTPSNDWPPVLTNVPQYNGGEPIHYVDWCDAYAYCKWAGKRLCGKIGAATPNDPADYKDRLKDEWYNACSAQGVNDYPYGSPYNKNGSCDLVGKIWPQFDFNGTLTAGLIPCQGGAPGLYTMSGDVAEWEDSCSASAGPNDACLVRGGGYTNANAATERCDALATMPRNAQDAAIGFRCCL